MSLKKFKEYRALEKKVEARRKLLYSIVPKGADMVESGQFIAKKLKEEYPEWYAPK